MSGFYLQFTRKYPPLPPPVCFLLLWMLSERQANCPFFLTSKVLNWDPTKSIKMCSSLDPCMRNHTWHFCVTATCPWLHYPSLLFLIATSIILDWFYDIAEIRHFSGRQMKDWRTWIVLEQVQMKLWAWSCVAVSSIRSSQAVSWILV